jgi:hypothetical protein
VRHAKLPMVRTNLCCGRCNLKRRVRLQETARRDGRQDITDLTTALWSAGIMLEFNRPLSNSKYLLKNVLKALGSIITICNLHAILPFKITSRFLGCRTSLAALAKSTAGLFQTLIAILQSRSQSSSLPR